MSTKSKQVRLKDVKQGVTIYQLSFDIKPTSTLSKINNPYTNTRDITKVIRKCFVTGKPFITRTIRNNQVFDEYGVKTDKGYLTLAFRSIKNNKLIPVCVNNIHFTTINAAEKHLKYYNPLGA